MSKPPPIGDSYSIFTEAPEREKKIETRIYTVELTVPGNIQRLLLLCSWDYDTYSFQGKLHTNKISTL